MKGTVWKLAEAWPPVTPSRAGGTLSSQKAALSNWASPPMTKPFLTSWPCPYLVKLAVLSRGEIRAVGSWVVYEPLLSKLDLFELLCVSHCSRMVAAGGDDGQGTAASPASEGVQ